MQQNEQCPACNGSGIEMADPDSPFEEVQCNFCNGTGQLLKSKFTCHTCDAKDTCPYAWDWYNTNGDCLAEK